jgi:NADPH:quinone reductase-like Zn-dependent oxidoreductase
VLITGASGGCGIIGLQYAKNVLPEVHVTVTASERNTDLCKSYGADQVIDYKKENFTQILSNLDLVYGITTFQ